MNVAVIVFLAGCKPSVPEKYIQPNEMEDILYDYYVSKAMANSGDSSTFKRTLYYYATLKKHAVSEAEFDSSLVYYYTHAQELSKIYTKLSERIGNEAKRLGASVGELSEYANLTASGDTANIWQDATTAILLPIAPYNRMDFTLKADTTFHKGDSFMLNFTTDFMYQSGSKDAVAYVVITYNNDSVTVSSTHVSASGASKLRIPANKNDDIKEIRGFIYLAKGSTDTHLQKLVFINNIQLIRFHPDKTKEVKTDSVKHDTIMAKPKLDTMMTIKTSPRMMKLNKPAKLYPLR